MKEEVAVKVVVGMNVEVNVADGVTVGVRDGVNVRLGVFVAGWNDVGETVTVGVEVGVTVEVGVLVTVCVRTTGVRLCVEICSVPVIVGPTVGVTSVGVGVAVLESGASANASQPMQ